MELYHALNRGVDKRDIFLNDKDRIRFVHDLYEFNDLEPAGSVYYSYRKNLPNLDLRNPDIRMPRTSIVDIHGWCVMHNHYHLLLSERVEGGISLFLRKLNVGYANYFNERYKRSGTLFQGRTKKIHIASDAHMLHILNYVHFNPLDFLKGCKDWRARRISGTAAALAHLDGYRWSSYLDYVGKKNFPSVITTDLFNDIFKNYEKEVREYLRDLDLTDVKPFLLE
ncbi:MAG TPA: transposase [Candidatus Paceibacterota bacterium]